MSHTARYSSVLIAGATGGLGSHIAKEFLHEKNVKVSLLVRKESEAKAEELKKLGAHIVHGDLVQGTVEELVHALKGIEVVVSAVYGDPEFLYDGQSKLLKAAKQAGVKKFVPSSFGVDYNKVPYGGSIVYDPKKKLYDEVKHSGLEFTSVNNHAFAEYAATPYFLFDYNKDTHVLKYNGDLNIQVDVTTLQDVGKFTVEAALRHDIKNRDVNVRSDVKTVKEIAELTFGTDLKFEKGQELEELKNWALEKIKAGLQPQDVVPVIVAEIRYILLTQKGRTLPFDNDLFPNVHPQSFKAFLESQKKQ